MDPYTDLDLEPAFDELKVWKTSDIHKNTSTTNTNKKARTEQDLEALRRQLV